MIINLYTTLGCHLCEQALAMLQCLDMEFTLVEIEIADDDQLMQKYGLIIPVVGVAQSEQEIDWPFSIDELLGFVRDAL